MRQWIRSHLTFGNVISLLALFIALGGTTYAATGDPFLLGNPNSAISTTSLTAPVAGKGLQVTNTSTGTGATALGLNTASGHPPFTVNSGTKVTNLNADKLDGIDSSGFVPTSGLQRVGPITRSLAPGDSTGNVPLATVGNLSFIGRCDRSATPSGSDHVDTFIATAVDHSTFASLTQDAAGGTFGDGDMSFGISQAIAFIDVPAGTPNFNPITGSAVDPSGKEVIFNLYQGMNARNQPGQCVWGGT